MNIGVSYIRLEWLEMVYKFRININFSKISKLKHFYKIKVKYSLILENSIRIKNYIYSLIKQTKIYKYFVTIIYIFIYLNNIHIIQLY